MNLYALITVPMTEGPDGHKYADPEMVGEIQAMHEAHGGTTWLHKDPRTVNATMLDALQAALRAMDMDLGWKGTAYDRQQATQDAYDKVSAAINQATR